MKHVARQLRESIAKRLPRDGLIGRIEALKSGQFHPPPGRLPLPHPPTPPLPRASITMPTTITAAAEIDTIRRSEICGPTFGSVRTIEIHHQGSSMEVEFSTWPSD
ncbi:hypothetical protein C1H46_014211 [Malus baccata]|uniref:Uncharacterized protein n=1 Tax=Malus baccata TaxID=106549 RepID=A0A540MN32_MALBA|nr:hypothetical protein C1H46_014211 [Malus baccata]